MSDRLIQLNRLRQADPHDPDVLYMIAQEHAKQGDTAAALAAYDECLALDPNYLYAYFHKARTFEAAERLAEAVDTLRLGVHHARVRGDGKALSELQGYLDAIEP